MFLKKLILKKMSAEDNKSMLLCFFLNYRVKSKFIQAKLFKDFSRTTKGPYLIVDCSCILYIIIMYLLKVSVLYLKKNLILAKGAAFN